MHRPERRHHRAGPGRRRGGGQPAVADPAYRLFSGGVGTNGVNRTFYWNRLGNATTSTLRCRVAAGNTLLYIEIEGPRAGEANADSNTQGSYRQCVFLSQITPYLGSDSIPSICFGGSGSYHGYEGVSGVSRTRRWPTSAATSSTRPPGSTPGCTPCRCRSRDRHPDVLPASAGRRRHPLPDPIGGLRGHRRDPWPADRHVLRRLERFDDSFVNQNPADGMPVSYGGNTYKVTPRTAATAPVARTATDSGYCNNASTPSRSPMIAVRSA